MAKAWITDLWVKDAHAQMPDGTKVRIQPTATDLKNIRTIPEHFRTTKYGKGRRWKVTWRETDNTQRSLAFTTRTDAEHYLAELEDQIRTGKYIPPEYASQPFHTLATTWLTSKRHAQERTLGRYQRDLTHHILPIWANTPINHITRQHIDTWVTSLTNGTAPTTTRPLAPRTIRHIVAITFGGALRYAIDEGWLHKNPLARVELPKPQPNDKLSILTHTEVEALAEAVTHLTDKRGHHIGGQRDRALIYLLATTGARINEALALQIQDIDLTNRRAHINKAWTLNLDGKRILGTTKTGKHRLIPLPPHLINELEPLIHDRPAHAWLFTGTRTNAALDHKNWYNRIWLPALKHADLDSDDLNLTIHKLRHTAASAAIAAGADVKVVQLMLGHANATETLDTYSHLWPDRLDEVSDKMSEHRAAELGASLRLVEPL